MDNIYWGKSKSVAKYHKQKFQDFIDKGPEELERACRDDSGRLTHIINAEHMDRNFLENIINTTNAARNISKIEPNYLKGLLRHVSILNFFAQPSRRTFLSFSRAESKLGIQREEVRDLKTSSTMKGETDFDALRTQSSFYEGMVCRHPSDIFETFAVWAMQQSKRPIHIFNAGSGTMRHPTQAVLDYYTQVRSLGDLDGKTISYVGDCLRGRTIHSGAKLISLHKGVTINFVAPEEFQIDRDTFNYITKRGVKVNLVTNGLANIPEKSDVVYMSRIQDDHGGNTRYPNDYIFHKRYLNRMNPNSILMHPGPKREEIDPALDYSNDPRIMIWRQERNGMWTRLATMAYIFGKDQEIRDKYESVKEKMEKILKKK